mmetsp:Transcript_103935/g.237945  ORF Transcript_103935/g.237945 Transcript_103935/m.237945 type:complete len:450 (+) Transcript_103935:49-1398(+)|eukprot:CAMPEP_0204319412 /NCGR_PEP_ID=MMETSP0469-20131031/7083_1 /ASSEMBLY_ACC=CAM_ASM_000384 /TAXON_ID=2969 /ORGANISM="Oxyrrhis marina" /LENGTH=449 /DNA_ID=CAMNT_0051300585 /DNA_START=42 /DNA_END=1391 /DNA_ORIENTATION=-
MSDRAKMPVVDYIVKHDLQNMVYELVRDLVQERPPHPVLFFAKNIDVNAESRKKKNNLMEIPGRHAQKLFEATKSINSEIMPKDMVRKIIQETVSLLHCDRVSLFVYDKRVNMLILSASNMTNTIRVKPGQGIAGSVFHDKVTVNIEDCYQDERFDQGFDKMTGYRTKSLLCIPILDFDNEAVGVLQAINKLQEGGELGEFDEVDELLLGHLAQHAGSALRNAEIFREAIEASDRANALIQTMHALSADLGAQSMILTLVMHANELVRADKNSVWLLDESKEQLWSVGTESGNIIRIPMSKGIAGECRTGKAVINISDAYEDGRFDQTVDKSTGYRTKSILAIPITIEKKDDNNAVEEQVIGVIQMINKIDFDGETGQFHDDDVKIMETFARFIGPRVAASGFLLTEAKVSEADKIKNLAKPAKRISNLGMAAFTEAEGDEDEEGQGDE